MTTTNCPSDGTGRDLYSGNAAYATARTGGTVGKGWGDADRSYVGQRTGFYCIEAFESIDTSAIPDTDVISAATLYMFVAAPGGIGADFTVNAYVKDYGDTLEAADYVSGAAPGTLVATLAVTAATPTGYAAFTDVALPANINTSGDTRLVFLSSKHVAGTQPTVTEEIGFNNGAFAGTDHDPYIAVVHAPAAAARRDPYGMAGIHGI